MAKQGEIDYVRNMTPDAIEHALNKPFTGDGACPRYLMDMGALMALLPPEGRLLDLGCGTGWTSVMFARLGYDVTGQDIAEDMIALANVNKERAHLENLRFVTCDYEDMGFENEFEAAVFYDALHHAVDETKALQAVYRALKPGGVCITFEPGRGHADTEGAKQAIARFGVTERDMPPVLIWQAGQAIGFQGFKVYRAPDMPVEVTAPSGLPAPPAAYSFPQLARRFLSALIPRLFADIARRRPWDPVTRDSVAARKDYEAAQKEYEAALDTRNIVVMTK